jgi:hypothetical protein
MLVQYWSSIIILVKYYTNIAILANISLLLGVKQEMSMNHGPGKNQTPANNNDVAYTTCITLNPNHGKLEVVGTTKNLMAERSIDEVAVQ